MPLPIRSLEERFWAKVRVGAEDECWPWLGAPMSLGYGMIRRQGTPGQPGATTYAHRVAVELSRGPIPEGLVIDHLCRNRICVNPAHLDVVDQRTNILRGVAPSALVARTGICQRGHVVPERDGRHICFECKRAAWARQDELRKVRREAA